MQNMQTETLRNLQRPLKNRYLQDASAGRVTLHASGTLRDGTSCQVDSGLHHMSTGLHPAAGGDGTVASSADMLLETLVACAGVTMNAIATNMGLNLQYTRVFAEGDLDFRGTLGVDKNVPVGLTNIRLKFDIQDPISDEQKKRLIDLTERYSVIYQTLTNPPRISVMEV